VKPRIAFDFDETLGVPLSAWQPDLGARRASEGVAAYQRARPRSRVGLPLREELLERLKYGYTLCL